MVVAFPISKAAARRASYCSPVAPAMAEVLAIACSNSPYVPTASEINCPTCRAPQAAAATAAACFATVPRFVSLPSASPMALLNEEDT